MASLLLSPLWQSVLYVYRFRVHVGDVAGVYLNTNVWSLWRSRNLNGCLLHCLRTILAPHAESSEGYCVVLFRSAPRTTRIAEPHPSQAVHAKLALLRVILIFKR